MIPKLRNIIELISNKVDKVTGKDLSTNDFTGEYMTKLDGIEEGATNNTVEDSLESTSVSNALSANQGRILNEKITGTTLYENEAGTTGTITLSESAANFSYIEVFYKRNEAATDYNRSEKGYNLNGKNLKITGNTTSTFFHEYLAFSGTSVTRNGVTGINFSTNWAASDIFLIHKIIGYR